MRNCVVSEPEPEVLPAGSLILDPELEKLHEAEPELEELPASYSIPEAGALVGRNRAGSYELARSGKFPVPILALSPRRHRVPAAPLHKLLGIGER